MNVSRVALFLLLPAIGALAHAQSSCSSDGQPRPAGLLERFIDADCESCWSDPGAAQARPGELAIDWIVPGARGEDAPLSAAATRDALARLQALRRPAAPPTGAARHKLQSAPGRLRVAQGLPFGNYIGTSIELKPRSAGPWTAWLVLVETVPAGSEGTPIARNLVRNALQVPWRAAATLSKDEQATLFEARSMSIPEGARVERLHVVGWLEDSRGRLRGIAQSVCEAPPGKG